MRILEIGPHDGYQAEWLAQQFPGRRLHVDGVELNREAVAAFNARRERAGLDGECKLGSALDAPRLFTPHSYDAVVAYEVIEHVPDVDAFLSALEAMLAPAGRLYLSTPDGVFGTGGNPHHLRAMRASDLAELARRRGHVEDMEVGDDGIATIAYRPAPRVKTCAIYTGSGWEQWSPVDIARRGLGGSETAAVRLAEALNSMGWLVTVYGLVEPCLWRSGVQFHRFDAFDPMEPVDVLISSRIPQIFDRPVNAKRTLLWMHDVDCGDELTPARAARIDHVLTLSTWHIQHVQGRYPWLGPGQLLRIRNGVDLDRFRPATPPAREQAVLYTSSPDRGLDVLLELWPRVREQAPDAVLKACYSPVYWKVAEVSPEIGAHAQRIRELADQAGVQLLPPQSQPALAKLMLGARVWAHPSWNTPNDGPFHETSCIGAMEAQAAGLHVVASNWGALPETVRVGALIDGPGLEPAWRDAFVKEIVRGLTDPQLQQHAELEAPAAVCDLGWHGVADRLADLVG